MNNKKKEPQQETQKIVHSEDQSMIKNLLFQQVEKPKNLYEVRIVNVFEDRYRVNVWIKTDEDNLEKKKINSSYFVKYDGEALEIRA